MKSNLKNNIIYQTLYQVLLLILPIITSPYVSRVLGAERIGIYSYSYSVANYFVLVAALGINNHGSRVIAEAKGDKEKLNQVFSDLFTLHAIVAGIVCIIYLGYSLFFVNQDQVYAIIQIFYVVSAVFDINWLFFGLEQFKITVVRNTLIKIFTVVCVFIFVREASDLWKYCLIMSLGYFISQSVVWIYVREYVVFVKPRWNGIKSNIKPLFVLFVPAVAVSLYKVMDKIMLGVMSSKEQVGFYENSEKVINMLMGFVSAFGTVMLPRMSNLISNGKYKLAEMYMGKSVEVVCCIAMALGFGLYAVAPRFAPFFFGAGFEECGILMQLLSFTIVFVAFANVIRTQYLIPNHRDKIYLISVCSGAVINIFINSLLIPTMKGRGAAVGTVCAEIAVCVIQFIGVIKEVNWKCYLKYLVEFSLIGYVMQCCVKFLLNCFASDIVALIISVTIGGMIYLLGVLLILIVTKDDLLVQIKRNQILRVLMKK